MWTSAKSYFQAAVEHISEKLLSTKTRLLKIPAVQLVVRTVQELGADDASHMAAGVSYYAILSLFPLLLGLIALFGLFLPAETIQKELFDFFERNLPGAIDVLEQNIEDIIRMRGAMGVVSLVLLFWSASAMFGAISRTINRAYDVHRDRPFLVRKLRDIIMALGTAVLFLLSLGSTAVLSVLRITDLPELSIVADFAARFLGFFFSFAIFLLLYKFIPNTKTFWRYVWPGALLAAILFEIAKNLFILYLDQFASYESVYGSVASVIILLVWIYFSAFILILGAEFGAEYGRMREGVNRGVLIADAGKKQQEQSLKGKPYPRRRARDGAKKPKTPPKS
jgi:membrane protein